jgi:hypothetical protein
MIHASSGPLGIQRVRARRIQSFSLNDCQLSPLYVVNRIHTYHIIMAMFYSEISSIFSYMQNESRSNTSQVIKGSIFLTAVAVDAVQQTPAGESDSQQDENNLGKADDEASRTLTVDFKAQVCVARANNSFSVLQKQHA